MSGVSMDMQAHPRVAAACAEAEALVEGWLAHRDHASIREAVQIGSTWAVDDLCRRVARALLDAAGWDYDLAEAVMDRRRRGEPVGDVLARMDEILALPTTEEQDAAVEALGPVFP